MIRCVIPFCVQIVQLFSIVTSIRQLNENDTSMLLHRSGIVLAINYRSNCQNAASQFNLITKSV